MSQVVYRYALPLAFPAVLDLPRTLRIAGLGHGEPGWLDLWVIANPDGPTLQREVATSATGQPMPDSFVYLTSTPRDPRTGLVWHAWEVIPG